ncbi:hypothetical protein [Streptomyces lavendulae]|uniref:hypothetical protein n=1 Tax=Streptomyces lavendulae TaxID=1914 RepID=UPI0024A48A1D|nr:hypothetical protein [Streptomyces lavendulae]GLX22006.1 hypothetical protein Slala01_56500 [Streptomyces lavendulae subsp. lavendulae]GLX29714.1 hypothetical protein Slala02_55340 [Streptomyces lavendulae subsp. lavendulae]
MDGTTRPGRRRRTRALAAALACCAGAAALLTGCGAPASRQDGARDAAAAFERALAGSDHAGACALLAPGTREELERQEETPCARALPGARLPHGGPVRGTEVYGRQALLRLAADTLFLSQFRGGWKVVAAGCTPRQDLPYRCTLKGE